MLSTNRAILVIDFSSACKRYNTQLYWKGTMSFVVQNPLYAVWRKNDNNNENILDCSFCFTDVLLFQFEFIRDLMIIIIRCNFVSCYRKWLSFIIRGWLFQLVFGFQVVKFFLFKALELVVVSFNFFSRPRGDHDRKFDKLVIEESYNEIEGF